MDKLHQELYTRLVSISDWLDSGHYITDDWGNKLFKLDQVCRAVEEGCLTILPVTGEAHEPAQSVQAAWG